MQVTQTPQNPDDARRELISNVTSNLTRMHAFRRQYDQKRAYLYRQYLSQRDPQVFPDNVTKRSNTFVPYPHSNVETVVSRVDDAFFAQMPFFETRGRGETDDMKADAMQQVLEYQLHCARFKQSIEALSRTIAIYGHGALKVDWDWDYDVVNGPEPIFAQQLVPQMEMGPQGPQPVLKDGKPVPQIGPDGRPVTQPVIDPTTGQPVVARIVMTTKKVARNCPKFIAIDPYDLLVDPDGGMIAHMVERTLPQMLREAEMNPQMYDSQGLADLRTAVMAEKNWEEVIIRMAEYWNDIDKTTTLITFAHDRDAISFKDLRATFRNTIYTGFRRKMYGGKPILLYHGPNPFAHKRIPIVHTSYIKLPNEVYGLGIVETIADLSEALNKMTNMVTDNWNLGINRRFAYDVNADIDHAALNSYNVPGGKVAVNGNPNDVLAPLPIFTPQAGDFTILELYKGMIEMTSGVSDFYGKGVGSAGGNRTATGIQQVIGESNYRFKMFIRNLELDIFQPVLEMCASMVQQFCPDEVEYMITDAAPQIPKYGKVPLEELIGNYDFLIVAANYATNKIIRQRNMMALAQIVGESGYLQERPALVELAKNFDIPHPNRFIKSDQQVQQEQQAQFQQQIQMRNEEWQHEAQMLILQAMLNTEVKARVAQATPRASSGVGQGKGGGRPATSTGGHNRPPGAGLTGAIKSFAQGMGANALGLEGLGEVPGA